MAFIRDKKGIATVELMDELLHNLILATVDDEYYITTNTFVCVTQSDMIGVM